METSHYLSMGDQQPKKSSKGKWLAGIVIITLFILTVVFGVKAHKSKSDTPAPTPEGSQLDAETAKFISSAMAPNVKPCDDFYKYACGGWQATQRPTDADGIKVRSFEAIAKRMNDEVFDVIADNYPILGTVYETCLDVDKVNQNGAEALRAWFDRIEHITDIEDFFNVLGQMHRHAMTLRVSENQPFAFDTGFTPVVTAQDAMWRLVLAPFAVNFDKMGASRWLDMLKWMNSTGLYNYDYSETAALADAQEVSSIELKLKNIASEGDEELVTTPAEFASNYGFPMESYLSGFADASLSDGSKTGADHIDGFAVIDPLYFQQFAEYIRTRFDHDDGQYPSGGLRKWLQCRITAAMLPFLPEEASRAFAAGKRVGALNSIQWGEVPVSLEDYIAREQTRRFVPVDMTDIRNYAQKKKEAQQSSGIIGQMPIKLQSRADSCKAVILKEFDNYVSHLWVAKFYPKGNKKAATELTAKISAAFESRLHEMTWLTAATKAEALKKFQMMTQNIAYDEDWDHLPIRATGSLFRDATAARGYNMGLNVGVINTPINRQGFAKYGLDRMGIMQQNAFYAFKFNSINLIAGLLQEPLFSSRYPDLVNLAAYGWVIGHEIVHGFDNSGRRWNATGSMVNWWDQESEKAFNDRAKCLIDQYNAFVPVRGYPVNGVMTLGENIADLGGMEAAWRAYKKLPATGRLHKDLTNDQLFWVQAAQLWCSVETDVSIAVQTLTDVHAPGRYRVRGTFSNVKGFAETWGCTANSPYGRSLTNSKCEIW